MWLPVIRFDGGCLMGRDPIGELVGLELVTSDNAAHPVGVFF
jgi:hypothetical protein